MVAVEQHALRALEDGDRVGREIGPLAQCDAALLDEAKKTAQKIASKGPVAVAAAKRISDEPAYVLHSYDWSESSLILEVFCRRQGRVALVAKGAKKPSSNFRPVLLPLQPLLLTYTLAGEINPDTGWGLRGESWQAMDSYNPLGETGSADNIDSRQLATELLDGDVYILAYGTGASRAHAVLLVGVEVTVTPNDFATIDRFQLNRYTHKVAIRRYHVVNPWPGKGYQTVSPDELQELVKWKVSRSRQP